MNIFIPSIREGKIGGGWTFTRNFLDLAEPHMVDSLDKADIFFITGATLVQRDEFRKAKDSNAKIVLRVDGVPEDWRNRGTGWSRLRDYSKEADLIIYQSDFIKNTTGRLLGRDGKVIYNGTNKDIFNPHGAKIPSIEEHSVLYVNYRKAENNKRVEEAIERFRQYKIDNPEAQMIFVGNYSKRQFFWDKKSWDFGMLDLQQGKDWIYFGIIKDRNELASIMRSCKYIAFPSFADPCPNTLIEAMSSGCEPLWINDYGGQADIVEKWNKIDWGRARMVREYLEAFEEVLKSE